MKSNELLMSKSVQANGKGNIVRLTENEEREIYEAVRKINKQVMEDCMKDAQELAEKNSSPLSFNATEVAVALTKPLQLKLYDARHEYLKRKASQVINDMRGKKSEQKKLP